jgi:hypothetical protein
MEEAIKNLYKQGEVITPVMYFPSLGLTLSDSIIEESPKLIESIVNSDNIVYGSCIASQCEISIELIPNDLTGYEFEYKHIIGGYTVPLGIYKVYSCTTSDDMTMKDIVAYDRMKKIEVDVGDWYNGLTFPLTLAAFRASFLAHVGLEQDTSKLPLPNDSMTVEKTISVSQLAGRTVIEACEEINGCFGHINREGKFTHIILKPAYGLYPGTFYPGHEYPRSETDTTYVTPSLVDETITVSMMESIKFEEYTVKEITKLIIRQDDDDIGAIVGTGSNSYIIQDNFLVYGKSAAELETIATNIFGYIAKRPYRPYSSNNVGLPYIEVGDMVEFSQDDPVQGFVLQRTLTGIQGLRDVFVAEGEEEQIQNFGLNYEIQQLKGRTARIVKTVDEVSVTVSDLETNLSGEIAVLAGQVVLKVNSAGNIGYIDLNGDPDTDLTSIILKADNISLEGLITANNNFKILADGSMEAVNGKFSGELVAASGSFSGDLNAAGGVFMGTLSGVDGTFTGTLSGNTINSPTINGGAINATSFNQVGTTHTTTISNGAITTSLLYQYSGTISSNHSPGNIVLQDTAGSYNVALAHTGLNMTVGGVTKGSFSVDGYLYCTLLNGGTPINSANIGSYASPAYHTHTSLYDGVAKVTAFGNNFRPHSDSGSNVISCGSPSYLWTQVFAATPVISTSDETLKQQGMSLSDAERRVALKIKNSIKTFKFNDAVKAKGDEARKHTGVYAQEVRKIFEEEGLVVDNYALFCSDTWYEKDGKAVREDEIPYTAEDEGTLPVTRLGIRYEELLCFIIASL